jgi:phospholipid/cholesterol/gamma-HCH transport system substrate-binding protein
MSDARFATRVGLFVAIGLALMAALLLTFSKGIKLFARGYEVKLKAANVAGLKDNANVQLAGVTVGHVTRAEVAPDGRGVHIVLKIDTRYQDRIHADARFVIETVGLLGDQYVAIYPQENKAAVLQPGEVVAAEEPLSFQEVVRSAESLIGQLNKTMKIVNEAAARLDRTVLSEDTLTNVTEALRQFRQLSDRAVGLADHIGRLVETNTPPISASISNLVRFSEDIELLTDEMKQTVATNRVEFTKAVRNLERTSATLDRLASEVESGKGLAGVLFKDQQLRFNVAATASNLTEASGSLTVLLSNLNRHGLLYKPKPPRTTSGSRSLYPGNTPFN